MPAGRSLRPFVKMDVFSLFDNTKLIAWNVGIRADNTSPKDALGLATAYTNGPTFSTAGNTISPSGLTVNAYPVAYNGALPRRTLRLAFGVRFGTGLFSGLWNGKACGSQTSPAKGGT